MFSVILPLICISMINTKPATSVSIDYENFIEKLVASSKFNLLVDKVATKVAARLKLPAPGTNSEVRQRISERRDITDEPYKKEKIHKIKKNNERVAKINAYALKGKIPSIPQSQLRLKYKSFTTNEPDNIKIDYSLGPRNENANTIKDEELNEREENIISDEVKRDDNDSTDTKYKMSRAKVSYKVNTEGKNENRKSSKKTHKMKDSAKVASKTTPPDATVENESESHAVDDKDEIDGVFNAKETGADEVENEAQLAKDKNGAAEPEMMEYDDARKMLNGIGIQYDK